jgi:RimJ/RimL family protein N-acetyltransferase
LPGYWPPAELRLRIADLVLRPMIEADLQLLADLLPEDVEQDPALPVFETASDRATGVALEYWRSLGNWRPQLWSIGFVVQHAGLAIGVQRLRAENFQTLRTVETASWLATHARGRGIGRAMRLAVLALAFDGLHAAVAESSAWDDNAASIAVSRALGYVDNGVVRRPRGPGAGDMVRMRLPAQLWQERHSDHGVQITGLEPCLPFFGVPAG